MKKTTMMTIANYLESCDLTDEMASALSELRAELNRGAEKKAANQELYAQAEVVLMKNLDYAPATASELFEACEPELPDGFSKGKFVYALSHGVWSGVVKIEGNPAQYRRG